MIHSVHLCKYILAKIGPMSQLKLQKLLYYIQAWHLVFLQRPIIEDKFEAWVHGPVSPTIWHLLKDKSYIYDNMRLVDESVDSTIAYVENILSSEQLEVVSDVLNEYGDKSGYYLENLTHSEAPWLKAREGYAPNEICSNIISEDDMINYYRSLLK